MNPRRNLSVLLVEDDEVDVMNVKRSFKKNEISYPLYHAENGVEALELLRGSRMNEMEIFPNIILLDINMPKMNGIEFLEELRKDPKLKNIIVIVLTTSNDDKDLLNAYNFNVAGYILKPVTFDAFREAIKTFNQYWEMCEHPN